MDLREFLRVLRKNWIVLAVVTLLGGVGGLWAAFTTQATYRSTTQVYASSAGADASVTGQYSGGLTTAQRVATFVQLVSSPMVSEAIANQLGQPGLAGGINGEIVGSQPTATYLITATVTDHSAKRAHTIADAFGKVFGDVVNRVETGGSGNSSPFRFTVVRPASFNPHALSPNKRLDVALGLILGLVVAVLLAMLRHVLDGSVREVATLSERFGLPVLAVIPARPRGQRRALVAASDEGPGGEAYRQLRTSLQFAGTDGGAARILVVTSPSKTEGKTTTAANLALAMARSGATVALVDADLRRSTLDQFFGPRPGIGLTNVLLGSAALAEALQPVQNPDVHGRLRIVSAGPSVGNPTELLGSTVMSGFLAELSAAHDYVVVDTPALLPVADATVLAAMSDAVLLVVRHGSTQEQAVDEALHMLRQVDAKVIGAVVAMAPAGMGVRRRADGYQREAPPVVDALPSNLRPATSRARVGAADTSVKTASTPRTRALRTRSRAETDVG